MKKYLFLLMAVIAVCLPAWSQKRDREEMRKEILEFKLKFIAQEINLKDSQRKQFIDLYTKMEGERFDLYSEAHRIKKKVKEDAANATDEDFEKAANLDATVKKKDAEIEQRYNVEFKKFLTPQQLYKMKEAEEQFRKKMKEMRKERKGKKK